MMNQEVSIQYFLHYKLYPNNITLNYVYINYIRVHGSSKL